MWLKLVSTTNCNSLKTIFVCQKHFTNKFLNMNGNLVSLMRKNNPILTQKKRCKLWAQLTFYSEWNYYAIKKTAQLKASSTIRIRKAQRRRQRHEIEPYCQAMGGNWIWWKFQDGSENREITHCKSINWAFSLKLTDVTNVLASKNFIQYIWLKKHFVEFSNYSDDVAESKKNNACEL